MTTDILNSDNTHHLGEIVTHSPAQRSTRHAALLVLAGMAAHRRRPERGRRACL